jgi:VanZ family protein
VSDELPVVAGGIMLVRDPHSLTVEIRNVQALTPDTARALGAVANLQHAVPAVEQTKRSKEETKREWSRLALIGGIAILGTLTPGLSGGERVAVWAAALAVLGAPAVIDKLKKRPE